MTGVVFEIQRFCIHDGPGIRTGVFLKGCPLDCLWCHNPESHTGEPELRFSPAACVGCGECFRRCPNAAHVCVDGEHRILRDRCRRCFACAEVCHGRALEVVGVRMSGDEVVAEAVRDRAFYELSGGGLTLSGGEPFAQPVFALEILRLAKHEGLHTCVETSGYTARQHLLEALPMVDLVLFDCKETDPDRHRVYTGGNTEGILANLHALDEAGARIVLRCPLVPGYNLRPDHLEGIARLSRGLKHCVAVEVLAYHRLGEAKLDRLGIRDARRVSAGTPELGEAEVAEAIEALRAKGSVNPRRG